MGTMTRKDRAREALVNALRPSNSFDYSFDASRASSAYWDHTCFICPSQAIATSLAFANQELERIATLIDNYEPIAADGPECDAENFAAERIAQRIRAMMEEE